MAYIPRKCACGAPSKWSGLCVEHWRAQAFERRINKTETCWLWTGSKNTYGYGIVLVGNRARRAHRFALKHFLGIDVPDEKVVMHSCDTPACVNPMHLSIATRLENNRDAKAKGRNAHGARNGHARLTTEQVSAIRADVRLNDCIAKDYGIAQSTVSRIKNFKRRVHT